LACGELVASVNDFRVLTSEVSIAAVNANCTFGVRSMDVIYTSASRALSVGCLVRWE
jgi:hypothetical protein